jgi:hypothetical protein
MYYSRDNVDPAGTILVIIVTVAMLSFLVGIFIGSNIKDNEFKKTAVKAGVAKWVNDPDGDPKFEWIINGENK